MAGDDRWSGGACEVANPAVPGSEEVDPPANGRCASPTVQPGGTPRGRSPADGGHPARLSSVSQGQILAGEELTSGRPIELEAGPRAADHAGVPAGTGRVSQALTEEDLMPSPLHIAQVYPNVYMIDGFPPGSAILQISVRPDGVRLVISPTAFAQGEMWYSDAEAVSRDASALLEGARLLEGLQAQDKIDAAMSPRNR